MNQARYVSLVIALVAIGVSSSARADDFYDFGGYSDPVDVGYDSYGDYSYDGNTGDTLADTTSYAAPSTASSWDYASTVPEGGYTIINNVMWPTCYGCTAGMTGAQATALGVYDAYRQYNSWSLFFGGYGWTDSVYMGTYQGDTSFLVSNNFAFTHDFVVENMGQSMFNLTTPYCTDLCVATLSNGSLTDAISGNYLSNRFGTVYDSFNSPALPPSGGSSGGGDGDGDGDGDGG